MANPAQPSSLIFGSSPRGTVFALALLCLLTVAAAPVAQAQTYNLLHEFSNLPDGDAPYASVTMDRAGKLYGTTTYGGANGKGLVFKLSHKGDGWILSPLYSFTGGSDDGSPQTPVTIGPDGSLHGTTQGRYLGGGTVYKLSPPARACASISCPWTHTVIFNFNGADGYYANSVIFDQAGNLYGTTESGGSAGFGVSRTHAVGLRLDPNYPA